MELWLIGLHFSAPGDRQELASVPWLSGDPVLFTCPQFTQESSRGWNSNVSPRPKTWLCRRSCLAFELQPRVISKLQMQVSLLSVLSGGSFFRPGRCLLLGLMTCSLAFIIVNC